MPPGYGVILRDPDTTVVIGPDGTQTVERRDRHGTPPLAGDELGRFLNGLEHDPATGSHLDSSGASGGSRQSGNADTAFPDVGQ